MPSPGRLLVVAGAALVVLGLAVQLGWLSFFGRLPGDIRIERPSFRIYVPITSCIVVSLVLSFLIWVYAKIFR